MATVGAYLIRIGVNLAQHVLELVLNGKIWIAILRVSATFVILIIVVSLIGYVGPSVIAQILREWWPYEISAANFKELGRLAGGFLLILMLINTICRLWELVEIPLKKSAFAAAMLMVAWALSGLICFGITRIEIIKFSGFTSVGLYTLFFLLFLGSVFIFQLCYHLMSRFRRNEPTVQPHTGTWSVGSIIIFLFLTVSVLWWVRRSGLGVKTAQAETVVLNEQQQQEERRKLREETRKSLLERGKAEGKDVWQTGRLVNQTDTIIDVRTSTDGGRTWRLDRLKPNDIIAFSARNSDITVRWDSDPSYRVTNKQFILATQAFFERRPTTEEEASGPLNFFQRNESAIELYCND